MTAPATTARRFAPLPGVTVLGLSGKAGSGKSWMASQLRRYGFQPFALAWHLKQDALKGGDFTFEDVHYFKPPEARRYLQMIGTEGGRDIYGEDCWLRVAHAWMRLLAEEHRIRKFVVPDIRFPNEAAFIRDMGGKVVRLEHAHGKLAYPLAGLDEAAHRSETALDNYRDFDMVIQNGPDAFSPGDVQVMLFKLGARFG